MRVLTAMAMAVTACAACGQKEATPVAPAGIEDAVAVEGERAAPSGPASGSGAAEPAGAEKPGVGTPGSVAGGEADKAEPKPEASDEAKAVVAEPAGAAPAAADPLVSLPAVPDKAVEVGCFAMTGDGRAALMAVRSVLTDFNAEPEPEVEDSGISVEWVGEDLGGTLDCFADSTTCAGEDTPARTAFIIKHGMTGCPPPTMVAKACGEMRSLVARDDALWLEGGNLGPKKLLGFTVDAHDGGSHEAFAAAWQHPSGGPLFVGLTNSDTGLEEYLARAVPAAKFGRCE